MSLLARQSAGNSPVPMLSAGLAVLASLIVFGKYVSPILYYISERLAEAPIDDVPVMWDFWWPFYLIVASMIYSRARRSWLVFLALAAIRILWSAIVLTLFFANSQWTFWSLQWLFLEGLTVISFAAGAAFALSPVGRDEMIIRSRTASVTA